VANGVANACILLLLDLKLPGNRLEALKGNRQGQYSVRINEQWRVCFEWPKGTQSMLRLLITTEDTHEDTHCNSSRRASC
jgi:hypothetical protein